MCHRHVNNCIQLSTLRGATTSNTVLCTLPIFSVVKSNLFIRTLLLDRVLVTEKNTRTPRVHLVKLMYRVCHRDESKWKGVTMKQAINLYTYIRIIRIH